MYVSHPRSGGATDLPRPIFHYNIHNTRHGSFYALPIASIIFYHIPNYFTIIIWLFIVNDVWWIFCTKSDKIIPNPISSDGPAVNYNLKSVSQSSSNKPVTHKGKRVRNNNLFLSADCHSDYWIRRKSIFRMKSPHEN